MEYPDQIGPVKTTILFYHLVAISQSLYLDISSLLAFVIFLNPVQIQNSLHLLIHHSIQPDQTFLRSFTS